ncbi:MAG: response regulator [Promethearchaeota archaeon]
MSEQKKKKNKIIRWYSYVSLELDEKLEALLKKFKIKTKAEFIRNAVEHYIDYVENFYNKKLDLKDFNDQYIHNQIKEAINLYIQKPLSYEQIKQKLSPLKTSILFLEDIKDDSEAIQENLNIMKESVNDLEQLVNFYFHMAKPERSFKNFDILHVDDNSLERQIVESYFKRKGIKIISVETAEEALEIIKTTIPNVLLVDVALKTSQINGDQLCKLVKSDKDLKEISVVLISAFISKQEIAHLKKELDVDDIILKPIKKLADLDRVLEFLK